MKIDPSIFKDYDIRAVVDEQLDNEGVERLAQGFATQFKPQVVAIGRDMRTSGQAWFAALAKGFNSQGVDVIDLGMMTTDMAPYAAANLDVDLAIMITASHNPPQYNGFKVTLRGGTQSVSGETGFYALRDLVTSDHKFNSASKFGRISHADILEDWRDHVLSLIDASHIKPLRVVVDAGNGMAGTTFPKVAEKLPLDVIPLYFEPDGTFPNHLANPLLPDTHPVIINTIKEKKADLGIMFDGDGDRMFLFDENGRFLSGTLTTAMVAAQLLEKYPGSAVLYNAICGRIVPETIVKNGGQPTRVRVGYSIIKQVMEEKDAIFAGEHSGHYFFRENYGSDSGMVAALTVMELMSKQKKSLSKLVAEYDKYPSNPEMNFNVANKDEMMKAVAKHFKDAANIDWLDGVSIWYQNWWANVRPSNTQPVLRLNVEADNEQILQEKTNQLVTFIISRGGTKAEE